MGYDERRYHRVVALTGLSLHIIFVEFANALNSHLLDGEVPEFEEQLIPTF